MTRKRIAALQWFFDHGEVGWFDRTAPSARMRKAMLADGQLQQRQEGGLMDPILYSLTDKGRRDLHEATR